jgi:ribonuclease HI
MVLPSVERNIMKSFRKHFPLLAVFAALFVSATFLFAVTATTRYLHVRVSNPSTKELVRVNVPLTLAEKIIPAINHGQLRDGKIQCGNFTANNVNIRAILDALKTAPEGEFVTVQEIGNDVHVAKEHGQMVVHVVDKNSGENVDVTIPWEVAQALITDTREDQLNVEAAIKALENIGDTTLVRVTSKDQNVRVWVDSRNTDE